MKRSILRKLLPERIYHQIDTLQTYRPIPFENLRSRYSVRLLSKGYSLEDAKRLHASVYLKRGFVDQTDVKNGKLHHRADPYQRHAYYFGVFDENNEVVALARQIYQNESNYTLPIFKYIKLYKEYRHLHPSQVVEISAFVKSKGTDSRALLLLFHAMMQHSKIQRHRYWLLACDTRVYWRLKSLFGPVIRKVGPETFYMGSNVVPAEIDIDLAPKYLKRGYRMSMPPTRSIRKFLYSSFTEPEERNSKNVTVKESRFWDAYARAYDGLLYFHPYKHLIEHVAQTVSNHQPDTILDLGCGTGNLTAELSRLLPNASIDAVDWSRVMLTFVKQKVRTRRVAVYERDLLAYLRRTRKTYDVIVMNNVIYTIADRDTLWRLVYKRLNEGGHVVFANPDTGNSSVLIKNHLDNAPKRSLLRRKLLKVWMFDAVISLFGMTSTYDFSSEEDLIGQLTKHGFRVDRPLSRCYGGHKKGIDLLGSAQKIAR